MRGGHAIVLTMLLVVLAIEGCVRYTEKPTPPAGTLEPAETSNVSKETPSDAAVK